jgi:hypothetical protein
MGRQCFRVPVDWQHPRKEHSDLFQPMHMDRDFNTEAREWLREAIEWAAGTHADIVADPSRKESYPFYWMWAGEPPDADYFRPRWTSEPTHYQMYETTSEGTPISPVMESPEALAQWLTDHHASTFGHMTATYEQWLNVCHGAWAPSMIFTPETGLISGVEASRTLLDQSMEPAVTPAASAAK